MADREVLLKEADGLVSELYNFRDHFFESHTLSEAAQKPELINAELQKVIQQLNELDTIANQTGFAKAQRLLLRGKAHNVLEEFSPAALEALGKAVKLEPTLMDAWCHLGECYWKRGDVKAAHNCFTSALGYKKEAQVLRNLSMVLRAMPPEEGMSKKDRVAESVLLAKEAVQQNIADGRSWVVLANAHLAEYFQLGQPAGLMRKCLSAYSQAEKDPVAANDPDLHHNRAVARLQLGEFPQALEGFSKASALDPTWGAPQEKGENLKEFLRECHRLTKQKGGGMKEKKLKQNLAALKERRVKDLGPYGEGDSAKAPMTLSDVDKTTGHVLPLKITTSIPNKLHISCACCVVDEANNSALLNIFNLDERYYPKPGDTVVIADPVLRQLEVPLPEGALEFKMLHVTNPDKLCVNGKLLSSAVLANPILSSELATE